MSKKFKSWWWRPNGKTNFGDEIGHQVLKKLGYKIERSNMADADIFTTGTILHLASQEAKLGAIIWGSGSGWRHVDASKLDVRAVRGSISRRAIQQDVVTGDPALLAPLFWEASQKKYEIGVVRHINDANDYDFADHIIEASWPTAKVIREITKCDYIASSSLHGLIVAMAYGIPTMRLPSDIAFGDLKWVDFTSSLDAPISEIQKRLIGAL